MVLDSGSDTAVVKPQRMPSPEAAFLLALVFLPVIPLAALVARDWVYSAFHWVNTETPQGSVLSWEVLLIAGVCPSSAALVAVALRRQSRR